MEKLKCNAGSIKEARLLQPLLPLAQLQVALLQLQLQAAQVKLALLQPALPAEYSMRLPLR